MAGLSGRMLPGLHLAAPSLALHNPSAVGLPLTKEVSLVLVAMVFTPDTNYNGPVSLAPTVMSTKPPFVFALGIVLSMGGLNGLNEQTEDRILATKLLATR